MTKTSLAIDRDKADAAAAVLGTKTLTATIDAALSEVVKMDRRRRLIERIRPSERGIGPTDDELRAARARREGRVPGRHERLEPQQRDARDSLRWTDLAAAGAVAVCPPVRLELLFSARDPDDYDRFASELDSLPSCMLSRRAVDRAASVQALLAERSEHRGPAATDLFVAAIAEVNDLTLVHYDRHFDAIARVTGQPTEWIAPRGSLD